jgi:hypothetical protein
MKNIGKQGFMQTGSLFLCVVVAWVSSSVVESSEFSGGRVTGRLLTLQNAGLYLFVAAVLLTFVFRRLAAGVALAASLLTFPFYLYFVLPGLFRSLFKGEYSVPLHTTIVWDKWAIAGILTLAAAVYICVRSLTVANDAIEEARA